MQIHCKMIVAIKLINIFITSMQLPFVSGEKI